MYEQPSRGRRIGPALVAVLVLLAALAGTGSWYLTRQALAGPTTPIAGGATPTGTGGPAQPAPTTPAASAHPDTSPRATSPASSPSASATPDPAAACPTLTELAVRAAGLPGGLKLLLYVDATGSGPVAGAEAWICQNTAGTLFYQGHRRTGLFTAATSNDTILVGKGIRGNVVQSGDEFVATNPKDPTIPDDPNHTDYHVSATAFYYVDLPQNNVVTYKIIRTGP